MWYALLEEPCGMRNLVILVLPYDVAITALLIYYVYKLDDTALVDVLVALDA